jgi:hypothetical protein
VANNLSEESEINLQIEKFRDFRKSEFDVFRRIWKGKSASASVSAGNKISIQGGPAPESGTVNLLVYEINIEAEAGYEIENVFTERFGSISDNISDFFEVSFSAIKGDLNFIPPVVTPKPKIYGLQTAVVLTEASGGTDRSSNGQSVAATATDKYARVKIAPHWGDRIDKSHKEFLWARVAQSRAGNGFGVMNLPRNGEEVVISFIDGNIDEPLVVGSVYNSRNNLPLPTDDVSKNQPDMVLRSRSLTRNNSIDTSEETLTPREPVQELSVEELKNNVNSYHEFSLIDTDEQRRVGLYSSGDIITQSADTITVKAGKKLRFEAYDEIEFIVGQSRISITREYIDAAIVKHTDIEVVPYLWSAKIPMTGTFFKMHPGAIKISSPDITALGWLGASMRSLLAGTESGLLDQSTHGISVSHSSGFNMISTPSDIYSYLSAMGKGLDFDPSKFKDILALLSGVGGVYALLKNRNGFGSGYVNFDGNKHEYMPGFMNLPVIGPVPLSFLLGEHEIKSTGKISSETLENQETMGKKVVTGLKKGKNWVVDQGRMVKHDISAVLKSKRKVSEEDQGIEMTELDVSKESSALEKSEEELEGSKTSVMTEKESVMDSEGSVMNEKTNVVKSEEDGIEMHAL